MFEAQVHDTIAAIPECDWNDCFLGALEDHAYHQAVEAAGLPGFRFFYVTVHDQGRIVGVAPAFLTGYDLETTLDPGWLRDMIAGVKRRLPGVLHVSLAALGSPCTDTAMLGVRDHANAASIAGLLLDAFWDAARQRGGALMAVKDLPESGRSLWRPLLIDRGYGLVSGLPVARLVVDFPTFDTYLARLSHSTRKDMRRKMRGREAVELRRVTSLDGFEDALMALYHQTRARAEMVLEELTPAYFHNLLQSKSHNAFCALYLKDGELLAANLLLHDETTLIDKFFVMGDTGRAVNLYFISWFDNINWCLEHGVGWFQAGQAAYGNKLRLGCELTATDMAFAHRNPLVSWLFKCASPLFAAGIEGAPA